MDWHLQNIIIYGHDNQIRSLQFHQGINIITGANKTGKSALLAITDYCLGSKRCAIPTGVIREFALWYAIRLQTQAGQLFLARANPREKHQSTDAMFIRIGKDVAIPENTGYLSANTHREAVIRELSRILGLMDQSLAESSFDIAYTEAPTIRNIAPFLFQPENIIANKALLFDKINQPEYQFRLRRILPYILGIIDERYLQLKKDLEGEQHIKRRLERSKNEQDLLLSGDIKAQELWNYAVALNLAQPLSEEKIKETSLHRHLASLLDRFSSDLLPDPIINDLQRITWLKANIQELYANIVITKRQLAGTQELAKQALNFTEALQVQSGRLRALNLLPEKVERATTCPLCNQQIPPIESYVTRLLHIRNDLQAQISGMNTIANPQLDGRIQQFRQQMSNDRARLQTLQSELSDLYRAQENAPSVNAVWAEQQRHLGAIRFYLEQVSNRSWDISELTQRIKKSEERLQNITEELEHLDSEEKRDAIMDELSETMTALSNRLNLEQSHEILRLDMRRTTLVRISSSGRSVYLNEIGSGENAIGYHLCAFFALHMFFLKHNRPVPSFLFLDQPSQVYSGGAKRNANARRKIQSADQNTLYKLYDTIIDITGSLQEKLQVIIVDHTRLPEKYQQFIIDEWWDGRKLI